MKINIDGPEFTLLYQGFIIGSSMQSSKPITQLRLECKILDALEEISNPIEGALPTGDPLREYFGGPLEVSKEALELIVKYMESVPWTTRFVRNAILLIDRFKGELEKWQTS